MFGNSREEQDQNLRDLVSKSENVQDYVVETLLWKQSLERLVTGQKKLHNFFSRFTIFCLLLTKCFLPILVYLTLIVL